MQNYGVVRRRERLGEIRNGSEAAVRMAEGIFQRAVENVNSVLSVSIT
jgi:hypothetical protein